VEIPSRRPGSALAGQCRTLAFGVVDLQVTGLGAGGFLGLGIVGVRRPTRNGTPQGAEQERLGQWRDILTLSRRSHDFAAVPRGPGRPCFPSLGIPAWASRLASAGFQPLGFRPCSAWRSPESLKRTGSAVDLGEQAEVIVNGTLPFSRLIRAASPAPRDRLAAPDSVVPAARKKRIDAARRARASASALGVCVDRRWWPPGPGCPANGPANRRSRTDPGIRARSSPRQKANLRSESGMSVLKSAPSPPRPSSPIGASAQRDRQRDDLVSPDVNRDWNARSGAVRTPGIVPWARVDAPRTPPEAGYRGPGGRGQLQAPPGGRATDSRDRIAFAQRSDRPPICHAGA